MIQKFTKTLGITVTAVALFVSSCGSNATFTKRYHNRGFNIAWGGGSEAAPSKTGDLKVKKSNSVVVSKAESPSVEGANVMVITNTETSIAVVNEPKTNVFTGNTMPKATSVVATTNLNKVKAMSPVKASKYVAEKDTKTNQKQIKAKAKAASDGKSQLIALILCIFVGVIGIHRFYLGYTTEGIIQLLTGGGCGVWALIDLIRIITGDLQPKDGSYTETL